MPIGSTPSPRARLIAADQIHNSGSDHGRNGNPVLVVDHAIEHRAELRLEHRCRQTIQDAADDLRFESDLADRAQHADGINWVGADEEDIRIRRLRGAHDRGEVGRVERIAAVMDDLQPGLFDVLVDTIGNEPRRLAVGSDDGNGLGLRALLGCDLEKALAVSRLRVGSCRMHGEVARIFEFSVEPDAEHGNKQLVLLHHDGNGGGGDIGAIARDYEVDLVDIEELGVDARDQ